ncbi:MAG: glucan 1,4-alpha-glucosidase [Sphingomonadales bacterium]|nr:glucan 1,4-alpha-glucosidase [Sphingomonadales bacterium]
MFPDAPGHPGVDPRWTSSAKAGVGTALSPRSPVWFTLSHGILNEVYYPRPDRACIRDLGLVVTGADGYFAEEKRDCQSVGQMVEPGVPAYRMTNTASDGNWQIEKQVVSDPERPCILQQITFKALKGKVSDYRVNALLAPHLVNAGSQNSAWIGEFEGVEMLFATGHGTSLALACSLPWRARSAGFVGVSDGWQLLRNTGKLDPPAARADDGNVALAGEIGFASRKATALLVLGFGGSPDDAARNALASLKDGFAQAAKTYRRNWQQWQAGLETLPDPAAGRGANYRTSTAVLATHKAARPGGATIASLSIPWGASKGDHDLGGYHLVWPRDLVETAGGFLAAGDAASAIACLGYLRDVQLPDGRWPQNMWLDGEPYWTGVQMDECALPILLADMLHRHEHLSRRGLDAFMPMVRDACGYLVANGPATGQDRWEEDGGYSPYTLAVVIAALLAAADLFDVFHDADAVRYLRETADCWNEQIEQWTFATDTDLCRTLGVAGYYVRIAAPDATDHAAPNDGTTPIRNRVGAAASLPEWHVLSPDALALVRFGLRAADDPRMVDTVKAIDHTLRCDLPQGPVWYRYTGDGYGEHDDGEPFDGDGIGRPWPLLTGERAHFDIAAGRIDEAAALLATLAGCAGQGGLLPEQVWDGVDMPDRELFRGRPSGSAMPLVWAHSEHIKLLRSLRDGAVFDLPPQGVERYIRKQTPSPLRIWRFNNRIAQMPAGKLLRIEVMASAMIHWSADGWATAQDLDTRRTCFGNHVADLVVSAVKPGTQIVFTFYWQGTNNWENVDYHVEIV